MLIVFFVNLCVCVCDYRRPSGWEEANFRHPIWPLQLQDSVERTGAGDGVYCRRTVSERIRHYLCPEGLKCPPARVSSPLFVSSLALSLIPGPPLKSPGPKSAAISQPSAHLSCTTRRPFVLWTCRSQTLEITAAPPGIGSARCTTPSASWSKVCPWWNAQCPIRPFFHQVATQSLCLSVSLFSLHLIIDLCTDANRAVCSVINSAAFCCALFYFQLRHIGSVTLPGTLF